MGFFKKETIILKESTTYRDYLSKLEKLHETAPEALRFELEKEIKITRAGIAGADNILYELKHSGMDLVVIHDLFIVSGDQSAQIDYLIITPKLNFILECKNLIGDITVNQEGEFIRSFPMNGNIIREGIYSPITQNERHLLIMKNKLYEESSVFKKAAIKVNFESINKPLVVLANPKTRLNDRYANKEIKEKLVRADQLIARIQKANEQSDEPRCSLNEMIDFGKRWLSRSTEHDGFEDKYQRYVSRVEDALKMERQYNSAAGALVCPKCGGTLILRTAKKGPFAGNQFYGCSNYYSKGCTFTLNVKQ